MRLSAVLAARLKHSGGIAGAMPSHEQCHEHRRRTPAHAMRRMIINRYGQYHFLDARDLRRAEYCKSRSGPAPHQRRFTRCRHLRLYAHIAPP